MSSSEEVDPVDKENDLFILNLLDEEMPFDAKTWQLLREYVL